MYFPLWLILARPRSDQPSGLLPNYVSLSESLPRKVFGICLFTGDAGCVVGFAAIPLFCCLGYQVSNRLCVCTFMCVYVPHIPLSTYHSLLGSMQQTEDRYINTQTDASLLSAPWMQVHASLVGHSFLLFTFISAQWSDVTHRVTSLYFCWSTHVKQALLTEVPQPGAYYIFWGTVLRLSAYPSTSLLDDALSEGRGYSFYLCDSVPSS